MDDDFNMVNVIFVLFDLVKYVNYYFQKDYIVDYVIMVFIEMFDCIVFVFGFLLGEQEFFD